MRSWLYIAVALALTAPEARAEALAPIDAQDPAFARIARERAPKLVWLAEIEREEDFSDKSRQPQRQVGYRGLVLPGDGRALAAFYVRDAVDSLAAAVPGTEALYFRAIDAEGRPGARIPLGTAAASGMFIDRGNGAAAALGAWRDGTVPLLSIAAAGAAPREIPLQLPFRPLRFEAHGPGYLVWLNRADPNERADSKEKKGPFHLVRLDAEGRALWSFEYPRDYYGFVATAARADGFTLAVLNDAPLRGIVAPVAALLLDRAGRRVAKHNLVLRGEGGPVPTGLHALRAGGFLLTGFWWGPGGNFVAWLDAQGRLVRYTSVKLGDWDEVQEILPLGDGGFLGTDAKGALLRFDRDVKPLWRFDPALRPPVPENRRREAYIYDIRVLAGNELLLAGSRAWDDEAAPRKPYVTSYFVERYRFE